MAELHVELVSVEREIWSGEASQVVAGEPADTEHPRLPARPACAAVRPQRCRRPTAERDGARPGTPGAAA
ncbi:MAG: hypothetical protein M3P91_03175, partial [Actinomycetota bacterium]|nr:hypothetical protein [Actinomycetota bacterium]